MSHHDIPRGLPVLAACTALIYLPSLLVGGVFRLLNLVRVVDDNLAEIGDVE